MTATQRQLDMKSKDLPVGACRCISQWKKHGCKGSPPPYTKNLVLYWSSTVPEGRSAALSLFSQDTKAAGDEPSDVYRHTQPSLALSPHKSFEPTLDICAGDILLLRLPSEQSSLQHPLKFTVILHVCVGNSRFDFLHGPACSCWQHIHLNGLSNAWERAKRSASITFSDHTAIMRCAPLYVNLCVHTHI